MPKKGGYQIIDFKNTNFTNSEQVLFHGVYNIIESTKKPFLLTGIIYEGLKVDDVYAYPAPFVGTYGKIIFYRFNIVIANKIGVVTCKPDDTVSIYVTNLVGA